MITKEKFLTLHMLFTCLLFLFITLRTVCDLSMGECSLVFSFSILFLSLFYFSISKLKFSFLFFFFKFLLSISVLSFKKKNLSYVSSYELN